MAGFTRVVVFLTLVYHVYASFHVITPQTLSNVSIRVWPQKYDGNTVDFSPVRGQLVEATHSNKTGKIILLRGCDKPYEPKYRKLQDEGAIAVLCAILGPPRDLAGNEMYVLDGSDTTDINVPIVTVLIKDMEAILQPNQTLFIQLITERNEFIDLFESGWMWAWQISLIAISLFNAGFAVYRIVSLVRHYGGCKRTVGLCCIILCLISTIGIMIAVSLDPFGCRRIAPYWVRGFIQTLPVPIVIAPLFLMALWWHTLLKSLKFQVHPGLPRFRWIFYAWVTFLIVQQIAISIADFFFRFPGVVQGISPTLYFVGYTIVLVYCCITLYRLKRRVKKIQAKNKETRKQLFLIRAQLYAVVIVIFLAYLLYVSLLTGVTSTPTGWVLWHWFFSMILNALITVQLFSLHPPRNALSADSSGTNSTSKPTIIDMNLKTNDRYKNEQISCQSEPLEQPSDTKIEETIVTGELTSIEEI